MKIFKQNIFFVFALISISIISCTKETPNKISDEAINVNKFIVEYMDYFYLWSDDIPENLDPETNEDSKEFFNSILYKGNDSTYDEELDANRDGDRWSFITDDLQGLLDYFNGVRTSAGYYPYAYRIEEASDKLALVVAYVYDNSPASDAGLKRGSVIMKIDGKDLTNNNINALFGQDSYTITLGKFDFDTEKFITLDETKNITKIELNTNPIIKSEIYDVAGKKVAYLLYNSFIHNYDDELISEFEKYKNQGVTELVLDLRYNGGGAVTSAINIASMIAPKSEVDNKSIFLKKHYNKELQEQLLNDPNYGEEFLQDRLTDKAYGYKDDGGIQGTALPNLNLSRVYVIGLDGTASASELVINGLDPYMNVITVGEKTHGKYTASVTFENKKHKNWAIQPIIFKSANAEGKTDYWNGLPPTIEIKDMPIYGDFGYDEVSKKGEYMLMAALKDIAGVSAKKQAFDAIEFKTKKMPVENPGLNTTMIYDVEQ